MTPESLLVFPNPRNGASRAHLVLALAIISFIVVSSRVSTAQVTIVQLSDTHIGEQHSPRAVDNLRRAVEMINRIHPDAVVLSGDIGEGPDNWQIARQVLKGLRAPLYYVPGNHDVHSRDVHRYRGVFGPDYYRFRVKDVTFLVIDSQLLGNFDEFGAHSPPPLPPETEEESRKMLNWLKGQGNGADRDGDKDDGRTRGIIIGIQHIPAFRDGNFPPDSKPYWVINEPYRSREIEILHRLGVRHMLVGHWHNARVFEREGIVWHVAPATSWLPWGGELGFSIHTISRDGEVKTEFVPLGTQP
jgi:DNA repair exonuclease SbcCD nuclease subunit